MNTQRRYVTLTLDEEWSYFRYLVEDEDGSRRLADHVFDYDISPRTIRKLDGLKVTRGVIFGTCSRVLGKFKYTLGEDVEMPSTMEGMRIAGLINPLIHLFLGDSTFNAENKLNEAYINAYNEFYTLDEIDEMLTDERYMRITRIYKESYAEWNCNERTYGLNDYRTRAQLIRDLTGDGMGDDDDDEDDEEDDE